MKPEVVFDKKNILTLRRLRLIIQCDCNSCLKELVLCEKVGDEKNR
jgi:hypothetical protein